MKQFKLNIIKNMLENTFGIYDTYYDTVCYPQKTNENKVRSVKIIQHLCFDISFEEIILHKNDINTGRVLNNTVSDALIILPKDVETHMELIDKFYDFALTGDNIVTRSKYFISTHRNKKIDEILN